jgi:hypothetical protein
MQKGPSEPFRTAAGASMLRGDAALPFKDVVRNFDAFTESVIGSMITFNHKFNGNAAIKGDFTPMARGATTLVAKEVQGMQIDEMARPSPTRKSVPERPRPAAHARLRCATWSATTSCTTMRSATRSTSRSARPAAGRDQQADKFAEANVRKILSDA